MMEEEEEKKKKEEETLEGGKKDKRVPWGTEDIDAGEQVALGKS